MYRGVSEWEPIQDSSIQETVASFLGEIKTYQNGKKNKPHSGKF